MYDSNSKGCAVLVSFQDTKNKAVPLHTLSSNILSTSKVVGVADMIVLMKFGVEMRC